MFEALGQNESICCLVFGNTAGPNKNQITTKAFKICTTTLAKNKTLAFLDFSGTCVGNEGTKYISTGLCKGVSLVQLSMVHTAIDHDSVESFISILKNSKIQHLNISKNRLRNEVKKLLKQYSF